MIIEADEIGWNTSAMAMPNYHEGISPPTASILVREFGQCPECDADIDPDVTDALYEDRDVIWRNGRRSSTHRCADCEADLRMFVEEKAFAVIGEGQLPDNAAERDDLYFVGVEGQGSYLLINPFHIRLSKAAPRQPIH
jgi:hypothetical protein